MHILTPRGRLLAGAALGFGLVVLSAQPAQADSVCAAGFVPPDVSAVCTDGNGNGTYAEVIGTGSVAGISVGTPGAVVVGNGDFDTATMTGYIESTTAGKGVIQITNTRGFTYTGTGSTLVGQAGASGATTLDITAPSVTMTTGTLTALGAGSNALQVTANGGAGGGGIDVTVDGDILAADGAAIILDSTNAAGDQDVVLTSTAGNTITAGNGDAIDISTAGSGGIIVDLGDSVSSAGTNAVGVRVTDSVNGGDISVTTEDVSATGTGVSNAIDVRSNSTGANVTIVANGALTSTNAGIVGAILDPTATGNVSITNNDAINAGNYGIDSANFGAGSITVNSVGPITATGGNGINALTSGGNITITADDITASAGTGINVEQQDAAQSGNVSVTTTGAVAGSNDGIVASNLGTGGVTVSATGGSVTGGTDGIQATATTGPIAVTLSGGADVTGTAGDGIQVQSAGNRTVTTGAGSVVTGDFGIRTGGAGTTTSANSGTITGTGGIAVWANSLLDGAVTVNNLTGGTINGGVDMTDANDVVTNAGTWNASGTENFYLGTDAVTNQTGGIINFATGSSFSGLESLSNAGTINVAGTLAMGGSTLSGAGTLNLAAAAAVTGLGATTLGGATNAGAGSSLAGTGSFSNAGTLDTAGAFTLSGFTTLSNSGTMDLAAGTLTVPAAVFTNTGTIIADEGATTITGQTNFANSGTIDLQDGAPGDVLTINSGFVGSGSSNLLVDYSGAAVDRLVITGAASGTTTINVTPTANVVINATPLLVVDTGTSSANAFVLGTTSANFGLIDLNLTQTGADYFLTSTPNVAAVEPVVVGNLANNLWYQSADIYSNYAALRRTDLGVARTSNLGLWGQLYYEHDTDDDQDVSVFGTDFTVARVSNKRYGLQAGVDYLLGLNSVLGITGGYERDKADVRHSAADFKASGWNLGAYAMFGGASGFYGDALVKYDRAKLRFGSPLFDTMSGRPDITSWGARGQLGYRFLAGSVNFDLGAGLAYVSSKIDDFDVGTIAFDFDRMKSLRGDLSARLGFGSGPFAPFVEGRLFHDFDKDRKLTLISGTSVDTIDGEGRGTWGRIEVGIGAQNSSGPLLAGWGNFGDVTGFGVKAGWRFGGSPADVAPPAPVLAPPPPPPAAPATQTCPTGEVILATDTCPVPPPPPPPPPVERGERGK
jgi:outer membrane autotransporter protein